MKNDDEKKPEGEETQTADGTQKENTDKANYGKGAIRFYLAVCCCALGAAAFGLAFTRLGVYSLIASVLFELASLAFCNAQKKTGALKAVKYVTIVAYVLLVLFIALFIGGIIYSSFNG